MAARSNRQGTTVRSLAAVCGWAALAVALVCPPAGAKMSVVNSPHNLSASGGRGRTSGLPGVTFQEERRICVFCHVPHNAAPGTPLWSRSLPSEAVEYQLYQSTTLSSTPVTGKPTGASRLCLSCHDGTIALGRYMGTPISSQVQIPTESSPYSNPNLSTDLRDDHPISIAYNDALATKSHLASPSSLGPGVRLSGGILECTACHDPHDNEYGNFLSMNNTSPDRPNYQPGSPLCVACHKVPGWNESTHNPLHTTALANGCMNCHAVHSAPGPIRLLRHAKLEDNCYVSCHNGTDPDSINMKPLFGQSMHRHPVDNARGQNVHDEKEPLPAENYHVQCVDCHNPHQLNSEGAPLSAAPSVNGRLRGVAKDSVGNVAATEYDVCFKCHSGGNAQKFSGVTEQMPNRQIAEPDQANRFDLQNPSYHPVTADRRTTGASLLAEMQSTMLRIYCSDCHNNSEGTKAGGTGPNGPHGSQYEHILIAQYAMPLAGATRPSYTKSQYALCYRCHSEDYVMVTGTAFVNLGVNEHATHVRDRQIPCFVCHDPHGVSFRMSATVQNNSHLINFDKGYTVGALVATPVYSSSASGAGSCTVNCHTVAGNTHSYAATSGQQLFLRTPSFRTR